MKGIQFKKIISKAKIKSKNVLANTTKRFK
jgi:hypothetical protein